MRAFFQLRLQVNFRSEESDIPDTEPFTLEGLTRYQLNQQLLNTLIEQQEPDRMYRRYRAAGELPYGPFGEIAWEAQRQEMTALASRVIEYRRPGKSMEIDLECDGVNITGWFTTGSGEMDCCAGGHLCLAFHKECNFGWNTLSTVLAVAMGESRLLLRKEGEWCFPPLAPDEASAYLAQLVKGYRQGMCQPLLFFT
ncbi:Exodeoxyribonuclease V gamma chain [Kluyvera cryocrescens]|uniref:Exodeoxyribonuclease V gamma chain n=1 Tax=Kluyvera cryocrescens TaxID=580 RepID=A0A485ARN9_KLUCR|nr:Exodeoxyribonuclease V gamma chain [Kluyvera cryocrescens]